MRDDQMPDAQDSVELHYKGFDDDETITVPKTIQSLDLSAKGIQSVDLTPLSSCSSLQTLEFGRDQLQSLDLSPLSSCTSLQELCLSGNQLQSLDLSPLSSCTGLQELGFYRNRLQSVDLTPLSSCTGLQGLYLGQNQLQSIDLSPLSSCSRLRTLDLKNSQIRSIACALVRETVQLIAPRLVQSMRPPVRTAEGQVPSRIDLAVLTRVVDTLWRAPDSSERWRAHAVVQDVLSRLELGWLGLVDGDPSIVMKLMNDVGDRQRLTEGTIGLICQQIDRGGATIGLDVERMKEHDELAVRVPKVLEFHSAEMKNAVVRIDGDGLADLRVLWLTAYGHSVLSAMRLGVMCNAAKFKQARNALGKLGFSLNITESELVMPTNISEPLIEYIWRLADLRAKKKKRRKRR